MDYVCRRVAKVTRSRADAYQALNGAENNGSPVRDVTKRKSWPDRKRQLGKLLG